MSGARLGVGRRCSVEPCTAIVTVLNRAVMYVVISSIRFLIVFVLLLS